MSVLEVETLIVGGGQSGLAMSEHLSKRGAHHLIVERHRIAERWRSERWDSLVANGPAWHDRFPGRTFSGVDPDGFATKDQIVDYFVGYAEQIAAPIRCGVEVKALYAKSDNGGIRADTSEGVIEATNVVVATGPFQRPVVPAVVPSGIGIAQIHSAAYRNPGQFPDGAVLVIGSGSSGVQIADELVRGGRRVYLSVGQHSRPPRRYRERDFVWWLGVLGQWDAMVAPGVTEHVTIAVSGANGGHTIDLRDLAARGITLLGGTEAYKNGVMHFLPNLANNIALGDANYLSVLDAADAYVAANGLDLPEEPAAPRDCVRSAMLDPSLGRVGSGRLGHHSDHLGDRLRPRFWLDKTGRLRPQRSPAASTRRFGSTGTLLPGIALAVAKGHPHSSGAYGTTPNILRAISQLAAGGEGKPGNFRI